MRVFNKQFVFSPSDFVTFFESEFASYMDHFIKVVSKESLKKKGVHADPPDPLFEIIAQMGLQHEKEVIEMNSKNNSILKIDKKKYNQKACLQKTLSAMKEGVDLIYQGAIQADQTRYSQTQFTSHQSNQIPNSEVKSGIDSSQNPLQNSNNPSKNFLFGYVDLLEKTKGTSTLGDYYYTPYDIKMAVHPSPSAIVQLCCYSDLLCSIQKALPEKIKIITKDKTVYSFRTKQFFYFYQLLKEKFLDYHFNFDSKIIPLPIKQQNHKNWNVFSKKILQSLDDISLVAEIRQSQTEKLKQAHITTMTELAQTSQNQIPKLANSTFKKLKSQARLQVSSREKNKILFEILADREEGQGLESLPPPHPADIFFDMEGYPFLGEDGLEYLYGNVIYEKPQKESKESLYQSSKESSSENFQKSSFKTSKENLKHLCFWAEEKSKEAIAFKSWIDWAYERWEKNPGMHIYHYGHYETSTLKRLMSRYGIRESQVDTFLRNEVFVDLYRVVKQGLRVGLFSYSLKEIEKLYYDKRKTEVQSGGDSAVQFFYFLNSKFNSQKLSPSNRVSRKKFKSEELIRNVVDYNISYSREKGNSEYKILGDSSKESNRDKKDKIRIENGISKKEGIRASSPFLRRIEDYNRDDCFSTKELCQFLWRLQKKQRISYKPLKEESLFEEERKGIRSDCQEKAQELLSFVPLEKRGFSLKEIKTHLNPDLETGLKTDQGLYLAELLASLLEFYIREDKPGWWSYYENFKKEEWERLEDRDIISSCYLVNQNWDSCNIRFEAKQEFDFQEGDQVLILENKNPFESYKILKLDRVKNTVCLKLTSQMNIPEETAFNLAPARESFFKNNIFKSLLETANEFSFNKKKFGLKKCIHDLLLKTPPDLSKRKGPLVLNKKNLVKEVSNHVLNLKDSVLCIQGPPGSGKTYIATHIILYLIQKGKRIGVTSNSHKAILNLLKVLCKQSQIQQKNFKPFRCEKICKTGAIEDEKKTIGTLPINLVSKVSVSANIVGATTYFFSRNSEREAYDYLFVDEASQLSLANTVSAARSAKNIILLGDQNQLDQPIKATHPGESGQSVLSYYTDGQNTIPEDRGVFLPISYRLHPRICRFVSDNFYDSSLFPDPANKNQKILLSSSLKGKIADSGLAFIPVNHSGNREASWEEVEVLSCLYKYLLDCQWSDKNKKISKITTKDVLIVAPYNLQVSYIKRKLKHKGLRVASIDKFQGQEAPISILSLSASSIQEAPRGIGFLFNKNRLNVAISRAKCLSILIGSKNLLNTNINTLPSMELMNIWCQIALSKTSY